MQDGDEKPPSGFIIMDKVLSATSCTYMVNSTDANQPMSHGSIYLSYILLTLSATAAFLGNFMVIIVITRSSKLHNITWCLLLNLAISDFLSASVLVPMVISLQGPSDSPPGSILCAIIGFMYMLLAETSIWTLALLSLERYFAVNQPLHYHQRVTKHRAMVAVITLWLCAVGWGSMPFFIRTGYMFKRQYGMCLPDFGMVATLTYIAVGICLPFVILCSMYVSIGRTAFTQAQRKVIECDQDNCRYVPPKHKDYRAVKILAVLAGVFATCWLPFNITIIVDTFMDKPIESMICHLSLALTLMNAAINPWLYSILNRTFRMAAVKQFRQCRRGVSQRFEDNKVRPPLHADNLELDDRTKVSRTPKRSRTNPVPDACVERNHIPLLPNQITDPKRTPSPVQKLLAEPEKQRETI